MCTQDEDEVCASTLGITSSEPLASSRQLEGCKLADQHDTISKLSQDNANLAKDFE